MPGVSSKSGSDMVLMRTRSNSALNTGETPHGRDGAIVGTETGGSEGDFVGVTVNGIKVGCEVGISVGFGVGE